MHSRNGLRLIGATLLVVAGCAEVSQITGSTWHDKVGWNAEDFFDDPQVIALCEAIEANDLDEMKRLIEAGADVNALGKGNMTPLLWAYPDNKLDRFELLLERGADPNVMFESDFESRGAIMPGSSITHMASGTAFPGYFDAVFDHGGDPNLPKQTLAVGKGDTPLFSVIKGRASNKRDKVQRLIDLGANLDHINGAEMTPAWQAVTWGGQYDIALILLEAGADHTIYKPRSNQRLVHTVIAEGERRSPYWTSQQKADYQELVKWLKNHGESFEKAKADRARWKSWSQTTGEYRRKMDAEVAERKRREAQAEKSAQEKVEATEEEEAGNEPADCITRSSW